MTGFFCDTEPVLIAHETLLAQKPHQAVAAARASGMQHCVHLDDAPQLVPTFYMHDDPALNHAHLRHCGGFAALRASSSAENTAEVGLHRVLRSHPARLRPGAASLVYLPVWEFTSRWLGECRHSSHSGRMQSAWRALRASPPWLASCGDAGGSCGGGHLWASTAYSRPSHTLAASMAPLSSLLGGSVVGRYKSGGFPRASRVGRCVVEVPYQVASATRQLATALAHTPPARRPARTTLLFFAGSLDVCCTGAAVRCAIGELFAQTFGEEGVNIRPTGGRCTQRALAAAANSSRARRRGARRARDRAQRVAGVGAEGVNRTAYEMATSVWCLVPAGDTCVTSRLYAAVALGCLPVVLCDDLTGALPERALVRVVAQAVHQGVHPRPALGAAPASRPPAGRGGAAAGAAAKLPGRRAVGRAALAPGHPPAVRRRGAGSRVRRQPHARRRRPAATRAAHAGALPVVPCADGARQRERVVVRRARAAPPDPTLERTRGSWLRAVERVRPRLMAVRSTSKANSFVSWGNIHFYDLAHKKKNPPTTPQRIFASPSPTPSPSSSSFFLEQVRPTCHCAQSVSQEHRRQCAPSEELLRV